MESLPDENVPMQSVRVDALLRQAAQLFDEFIELSQRPVQDVMLKIIASRDPGQVADLIAQAASYDYSDKMRVLAQLDPVKRLEISNRLLSRELEVLRIENQLQDKTQQVIDKDQRDYYLREQMKVIRKELGETDEDDEAEQYRADRGAARARGGHGEAEQGGSAASEAALRRLRGVRHPQLPRHRARASVEQADEGARERRDGAPHPDRDHFGLEKVKERILEILAVKQLAPELPGQIICLVGLRASAKRPSP